MEHKISNNILIGRPFGGTAVLIRENIAKHCSTVFSDNPRVTAVRYHSGRGSDVILSSIYMPCNNGSVDYLAELEAVIGCLQGIIDKYPGSKFILGGDLNVSKALGSVAISAFCESNFLLWLDYDVTTGSYTYHNDTAGKYSSIDFFMCSSDLVSSCDSIRIMVDDTNLSDHYAIICSFMITTHDSTDGVPSKPCDTSRRLDWPRADIALYQSTLIDLLSNIVLPVDALLCHDPLCEIHAHHLENYYNTIVDCLLLASRVSVPVVKLGVQKHWWSPELDSLKQECIDICQLWKSVGCPRNGLINAERLRRKYRYKFAVKEAATDADKSFNDDLFNNLCDKNHIEFWKSWRRKFCASNCKSVSCVNGQAGDVNIVNEFTKFFERVTKPNTPGSDSVFRDEVDKRLTDSSLLARAHPCINLSDMQDCISKLKTGKAISFDDIYNEHLIYGVDCLYVHLCILFNALLSHGFVPSAFKNGVVIPLLKNKHGDPSNLDMYRGITVAPAASKLFEMVVLRLYGDFLSSDPLQFGFKRNSSCNSALFAFTEAVKHCNNFNSKLSCVFLDASKAFDKVLHNGLFIKLLDRNVPVCFVRLLRNWYSRLCCMVRWNGKTGKLFPVTCGVRQGSVLSPFLFAVYVDGLISDLRNSGFGLYIGKLFIGCILYADDIVLLSVSSYGMQGLLDSCAVYGAKWDIKFNPCKSHVIYFGPSTKVCCKMYLNGCVVDVVDKVKYLGVYFQRNSGLSDISHAFVKFYSQFNNIMAVLGKQSREMTALHLVKTYCLPTLLFGCEIWKLSVQSAHRLNVAWNNCFRHIFGGFWTESVKTLQLYCGSLPISFIIDQRKLLFCNRLLNSENSVLRALSFFARRQMSVIGSKHDVHFPISACGIKDAVWSSFVKSMLPML